jgi:hypothetical protein
VNGEVVFDGDGATERNALRHAGIHGHEKSSVQP